MRAIKNSPSYLVVTSLVGSMVRGELFALWRAAQAPEHTERRAYSWRMGSSGRRRARAASCPPHPASPTYHSPYCMPATLVADTYFHSDSHPILIITQR